MKELNPPPICSPDYDIDPILDTIDTAFDQQPPTPKVVIVMPTGNNNKPVRVELVRQGWENRNDEEREAWVRNKIDELLKKGWRYEEVKEYLREYWEDPEKPGQPPINIVVFPLPPNSDPNNPPVSTFPAVQPPFHRPSAPPNSEGGSQ